MGRMKVSNPYAHHTPPQTLLPRKQTPPSFLLPTTLGDEIQKMLNSFWWEGPINMMEKETISEDGRSWL
ncbi:hypothetical protein MTR_2g027730 [Medicago truncatula]|uniref:Uncharacterized protein n=1 Tax=Medicago truncatula TaxID=3880 RepID=G7ISM9_MEDTR|nr:hypothetical protein MTR_2g027730 [Medicago truncatula]